jgi:hypothetical protein
MNESVRTYLIEAARQKDKFVYYSDVVRDCALDINTNTEFGRKLLSNILGEVSAFEDSHKRPLVSALAIYKDKARNDHGDGFYKLAEQLGKGKFKQLRDDLYGFMEAKECRKYWQNEDNYRKYTLLNIESVAVVDEIEFFNQEELDFFKQWQYKAYEPDDDEHVEAKTFLMDTVWEKSIHLGKIIIQRLNGFQLEGKKAWSQRGWKENEGGTNVQAAIFKPYTWIKVFRNTDKGKDIFFTFGVDAHPDAEAFIYKIDCQAKRDSKLNQTQIDLCKLLIPVAAKWNEIAFEDLIEMNWERLTTTCVNFINQYINQYDAIIAAVWGEPIPPTLFKNRLIKKEKPKDGFELMPESKNIFKGVDIDFLEKAAEQKDLGDQGEALVKQREIEFLMEKGLPGKAALVDIVLDGVGYDVLSFNEDENEKYIEVKTTTGSEYTAFYLTQNEIDFMRLNPDRYCIYRVFHYDEENNFGEFFELNGDIESQLLMKPIHYKVLIKKET